MVDLKAVYQASNKDLAANSLLQLEEKWGKKIPHGHSVLEGELG
jgi:putative transposase